jgi:hypothetical protein
MDVSSTNAMVRELAEAATEYHCFFHLIDHRESVFAFKLSDFYERPLVNEKLGVSRKFRTAMIFSKLTEDTKFMETIFRNRGYNMHHFADFDAGKDWLKDQSLK